MFARLALIASVTLLQASPLSGQTARNDFVRGVRQVYQDFRAHPDHNRSRCALGVYFADGPVVSFKYDPAAVLEVGDRILSVESEEVAVDQLVERLRALSPDTSIELVVVRNGQRTTRMVKCSNIRDLNASFEPILSAASRNDVRACRDASELYARRFRMTRYIHYVWAHCSLYARSLTASDWPVVIYRQLEFLINEARWQPEMIPEARTAVFANQQYLIGVGQAALYRELEQQLGRLEQVTANLPADREAEDRRVATGTGFFVSADGLVVTSHHVVAGADSVFVLVNGDRLRLAARVVAASAATDLAVLKVDYETAEFLTLASSRSMQAGDPVFTFGFPVIGLLGDEPKFTDGAISALSGPAGEQTFMQISVPVQPGNSGGPVVDSSGRVIGIVAATAAVQVFFAATGALPQNVSWAVKADYAMPLLPELGEPIVRSRESAIAAVRRAVVLVESRR